MYIFSPSFVDACVYLVRCKGFSVRACCGESGGGGKRWPAFLRSLTQKLAIVLAKANKEVKARFDSYTTHSRVDWIDFHGKGWGWFPGDNMLYRPMQNLLLNTGWAFFFFCLFCLECIAGSKKKLDVCIHHRYVCTSSPPLLFTVT